MKKVATIVTIIAIILAIFSCTKVYGATVMILDFSIVPQDTITAGNGYKKVPDFHVIFDIFIILSFLKHYITFL